MNKVFPVWIVFLFMTLPATGSEFLQKQRETHIAEINNDPQLKENVLKMLNLEETGIIGKIATMEALLNRAIMTGIKIRDELFSGFYGPVNRGRLSRPLPDAARASSQSALDEAAAGSNLIQSRTDQGRAGDPNAAGPGQVRLAGISEIFNHWQGRRGGKDYSHSDSRAWSEEQERQNRKAN